MSEISFDDRYTVPGRHWRQLDDGRVQCDVCPRACRLREGQRDLCFVRGRVAHQVVSTSYGRSSGFWVGPIEKKPLNHPSAARRRPRAEADGTSALYEPGRPGRRVDPVAHGGLPAYDRQFRKARRATDCRV